jgi:hypothetical protein
VFRLPYEAGGRWPARIETPDGRVIGIEVKAGATARTEDLAGLRNLANHLGDKFVAGYVLYTGSDPLLRHQDQGAPDGRALALGPVTPADRSRASGRSAQRRPHGTALTRSYDAYH